MTKLRKRILTGVRTWTGIELGTGKSFTKISGVGTGARTIARIVIRTVTRTVNELIQLL